MCTNFVHFCRWGPRGETYAWLYPECGGQKSTWHCAVLLFCASSVQHSQRAQQNLLQQHGEHPTTAMKARSWDQKELGSRANSRHGALLLCSGMSTNWPHCAARYCAFQFSARAYFKTDFKYVLSCIRRWYFVDAACASTEINLTSYLDLEILCQYSFIMVSLMKITDSTCIFGKIIIMKFYKYFHTSDIRRL